MFLYLPEEIVWTSGLGQYGQLTQYDTQNIPVFNPVMTLPYDNLNHFAYIMSIAAGKHHAVALIQNERVIAAAIMRISNDVCQICNQVIHPRWFFHVLP